MRLPRYDVQNDGAGPYAVFYCDKCGRDFRTEPAVDAGSVQVIGRSAIEGLLREIPVVGDAIAGNIEDPRYQHTLSLDQVRGAWDQVREFLHECPTCHMFVCPAEYDARSGYCKEDRPKPRPPATAPRGKDRSAPSPSATAEDLITCPHCRAAVPAKFAFCTNCGQRLAPPEPVTCPQCGTAVEGRFCGNCGTKVAD
jgi:Double zinc ribbon